MTWKPGFGARFSGWAWDGAPHDSAFSAADFFRAVAPVAGGTPDPRSLGLTAAQHVTLVFLGVGVVLLVRSRGTEVECYPRERGE